MSLIFVNLINMCLGMFLLGFILYGTLHFLDFSECFLSYVKEVFSYYLFKYFLRVFLSLFSSWDPYKVNVGAFTVVLRSLRLSSFLFITFSLFCFEAVISTICLPAHLSVLLPDLFSYWFLLMYFFMLVIVLFISGYLFFVYLDLC